MIYQTKTKKVLLTLLYLLFSRDDLLAFPNISDASGVVSNGEIVEIFGHGFGENGPNIVLFDDFEKGENGIKISVSIGSAQINNWSRVQTNCGGNDTRYPIYSSEWSHSGFKSMKSDWATSAGCIEPGILARLEFPSSSEVFYSFWAMVPSGKNVPGDQKDGKNPIGPNWKLSWLFNSPFGNEHMNDYISAVILQEKLGTNYTYWFCFNDLVPNREGGGERGDSMNKGKWSRFDIYQKGEETNGILQGHELVGNKGRVEKLNKKNVFTLEAGYGWNTLTIPGYGRGYTNDGVTLYDDVYVATGVGARARVEIGSSQTYSRSSNLSICTVTSWYNDRIKAIIRQGGFRNGQQAFLYVVDCNGEVNTKGYPVTIGHR